MIIVYYVRGCREGEVDGAVCSRASVSREASSTYIKIFIYSLLRCMYSRNLPIGAAYKFLRMPPDSVPHIRLLSAISACLDHRHKGPHSAALIILYRNLSVIILDDFFQSQDFLVYTEIPTMLFIIGCQSYLRHNIANKKIINKELIT